MGPLPEWSTFFVIVYVVFLSVLYARDRFLPGQTDVFPVCGRLHLLQSLCVFSSLLWMCSAESQCTGAVGRVSRPRSSTCTFSLSSIFAISLSSCMTFTCTFSRFLFFNFQVAWSGVRIVSFTCSVFSAELEWSRRLVALLRIPSRTGCPLSSGFLRPQSSFTPCMP